MADNESAKTMGSQGGNMPARQTAGGAPEEINHDPALANKYKTQAEIDAEAGKGPEVDREGRREAGDVIDLRAKVVMVSTDKDPHHKTGEEFSVHPKVAADIAANGFATYKNAKDDKSKKEK